MAFGVYRRAGSGDNRPAFRGGPTATTTGTIETACLDGGRIKLTSSSSKTWTRGSRVGCCAPATRAGTTPLRSGTAWRPRPRPSPPADPSRDVAAAVSFARDHGLLLSIKGGGHNIAGTSIAEDGLTLDLSGMREVAVDPDAKLAHVGPGCLLGDVDQATQKHGLATVLGFVSETGVAGLTLGGGFGYLTRRFGWTVDNLAEVEVVVPTVRSAPPTATSTLSCSGPCVVVAATSGWSLCSASACTRSARPSPAG